MPTPCGCGDILSVREAAAAAVTSAATVSSAKLKSSPTPRSHSSPTDACADPTDSPAHPAAHPAAPSSFIRTAPKKSCPAKPASAFVAEKKFASNLPVAAAGVSLNWLVASLQPCNPEAGTFLEVSS